jgi:hypothetical protein
MNGSLKNQENHFPNLSYLKFHFDVIYFFN